MPTYEFRCPQGHEFERFYRTISGAEAQAACPECGQLSERMMSATGFAFKGSGFYLTDYGKNAHRDKGTPTQSSPAAGDAAKGEAKAGESTKSDAAPRATESKPASSDAKPASAPAKKSAE